MAIETKPVKLAVEAHSRLADLGKELQLAGLPGNVEKQDMVSALVLYTTAPQLAGMLSEYWRNTAKLSQGD
jgi:hypothetical protein